MAGLSVACSGWTTRRVVIPDGIVIVEILFGDNPSMEH